LSNKRFSIIKDIVIGPNSRIYDQVNLYKCYIGKESKIDAFVYIEEGVIIGDRVKIRPFTFIPSGVRIENDVFIGPHVTFTNDKYPKIKADWKLLRTTIRQGASIGAGSVVLPVTIGKNSLIGAGSVVTKDVPDNVAVAGNPARVIHNKADHRTP
jgi:UDP-2-acetamido-3-amino-2,3-dideoxy-glucuronate N-acetyltransferase